MSGIDDKVKADMRREMRSEMKEELAELHEERRKVKHLQTAVENMREDNERYKKALQDVYVVLNEKRKPYNDTTLVEAYEKMNEIVCDALRGV